MEMDIRVEGFEQVLKAINSLPGLLAERVTGNGLLAAARVVRDQAKALVPVRSGALQGSIRTVRRSQYVYVSSGARRRVPGAAAQVVAGGKGARHVNLIEYGTVRSKARPFLEPALVANTSRQLSVAVAAMARSFVKIGRDLAAGRSTGGVRRLAAG